MDPILEELQLGFREGLGGLTAEQTQWRTEDDPARWSVQQIVEHVVMTYDLSGTAFATRLAKGTSTKARPNARQWLGQIMVLRLAQFPQGRVAPEMVMPRATTEKLSGEQLAVKTGTMLERFDGLAAQAEAMFGSARAVNHPILGPMSVWGWRRFHLMHGQHHLRQVRAIRKGHGLVSR